MKILKRYILVSICFAFMMTDAWAGTAFFNFPSTFVDATSIVPCDANGQPDRCVKEWRVYYSQASFTEIQNPPAVAYETVNGARTSWCLMNVNKDIPIYLSVAVVFWDGSASPVSDPAFNLPGNIVGRSSSDYASAVVDGLDLIYLRRNFGSSVTVVGYDVSQCPQNNGGIDFPLINVNDEMAADLNRDGVIDGLDLILLRRLFFGGATE